VARASGTMASKSHQEEYARSAFHAWLLEEVSPMEIAWRPLSQQEEPPDYFLEIGVGTFAVEVTIIMHHMVIGGKRRSSAGVRKHLTQFVERVEGSARSRGLLRGLYVVSARPIEHMRSVEADLEQRLLEYISRTRDLEWTPMEEVRSGPDARMHIRKRGLHKDYIAPTTSLGARGRVEDLAELGYLLSERLSEKRRKLERVNKPRILLLLDGLLCGTDDEWRERIPLSEARAFSLICRISAEARCTVVYFDPERPLSMLRPESEDAYLEPQR